MGGIGNEKRGVQKTNRGMKKEIVGGTGNRNREMGREIVGGIRERKK